MRKGQTSVEFLIIFAVALTIFLYIFSLANDYVVVQKQDTIEKQTLSYLNKLKAAANEVYYQGVGSRKKVYLEVPDGIDENKSGIMNNSFVMNVFGTDLIAIPDVNLVGNLPLTPGGHFVYLTAYPNYVYVGTNNLAFDKQSIYKIMDQSSTDTETLTIYNLSDENVTVNLVLDWNETDVDVNISETSFVITSESSHTIVLSFTTSSTAVGLYNGNLNVYGDFNTYDDENYIIPITVDVSSSGTNDTNEELIVLPSSWTLTLYPGDSNYKIFTVCNNTLTDFSTVSFTADNSDINNFTYPISDINNLQAETCVDKNIVVSIPAGYPTGTYTGHIIATSNTGAEDTIAMVVYVVALPIGYFIDDNTLEFNLGNYFRTKSQTTYLYLSDDDSAKELPNNKLVESDANMIGNVLLWHFNESSGNFTDYSGEHNTGYNNDFDYGYSGFLNTSVYADSDEDGIEANDDASLDITQNQTIGFWGKFTYDGGRRAIASKGMAWHIVLDDGKITYMRPDGDIYNAINEYNENVADDTWHYFTFVDTGSHIKTYIDGELVKDESFSGTISTNGDGLRIGFTKLSPIGEILQLNASRNWDEAKLKLTYRDPVVVCTYNYPQPWWWDYPPAVVRIRNVSSKSFEYKLQNPGDNDNPRSNDIYCVVIEEGNWRLSDGRYMEAHKVTVSNFNRKYNWTRYYITNYNWVYTNPVVLGQNMTEENKEWSVFWSSRYNSTNNPPRGSDGRFNLGLHIGEDTDTSRNKEMVGYIIIEAGEGSINENKYEARVSSDSVRGIDNSPPYSFSLSGNYKYGIATQTGMDGGDGGWAVLYGNTPISNSIDLAIDEDQINDNERSHTTEQVAYWVFENDNIITGVLPSFTGAIDEFSVWNRALSDDEVESLYKRMTGKYALEGNFESRIFDANQDVNYIHIEFKHYAPYGKDLPDNKGIETEYEDGNADMSNNVLLYHLDESSGNIIDYSGEGNDGIANGNLTYSQSGMFNNAIYFDGSNSYINAGDDSSLRFSGNALTYEAWVYWGGEANQNNNLQNIITNAGWYRALRLTEPDASLPNRVLFQLRLGSVRYVYSNSEIQPNKWYHIVGTYDGSAMRIYINGELDTSANYSGNLSVANTDTYVGAEYGDYYFKGKIDEVAIYQRALSAEEVKDHYLRGILRLKHQVRTCNDNACSGEDFVGPSGTNSYFEEEDLNVDLNLTKNQYFQYKSYFTTEDYNYTPFLDTVTISYRSD